MSDIPKDDSQIDKFTVEKGDLELTEEGEGPTLAELARLRQKQEEEAGESA